MKTTAHSKSSRQGFTLIELLVVIVIIAILAGASIPVIGRVMQTARETEARAMIGDIQVALNNYYTEYNRLPASSADDDTEADTITDVNIVATLLGDNVDVGSTSNSNPKKIRFMEPKYAKNVGASGESTYAGGLLEDNGDSQIVDPWGNSYKIVLDTNYDNLIENPFGNDPPNLRNRVIVWSEGVPEKDKPVTSWE